MRSLSFTISVVLFFLFTFNISAQTWMRQSCSTSRNLQDAFFINSDTGWVAGDMGVVFKTTNGGQIWSDKSVGIGEYIRSCFFVNKNTGWVGGYTGIYKTTDGGNSWNNQSGPDYLYKIYFYDPNFGFAVGGNSDGRIYITTDGGLNWTLKSNSSWREFHGVQFVDANTGWAFYDEGIIKTTNGGLDWHAPYSFGNGFGIMSMFFVDKNTGFVGGHNDYEVAVYKTTDGGTTWVNKTPGLQYKPAYIKFFDAKNGIIAGGAFNDQPGVLITSDGGESWTPEITAIPDGVTRDSFTSAYFISQNVGWEVGAAGSILKFENTTGVQENKFHPPLNFNLGQNYPNPFNPNTTISFQIPKSSFVSLKIYNTLGKEIATLVNEQKLPGTYKINFNANTFASGLYFYRLDAENFSQTKKLILLK